MCPNVILARNQSKPLKGRWYSATIVNTLVEMRWYKHGLHRRTTKKHDSIWVIVDRLTKTGHLIRVHTTYTTKKYAELYIDQIICLHEVPHTIISDRGAQFVPHFWEQLQSSLGTKLIWSSAYHPQTDGQTERVSRFLKIRYKLLLYIMTKIGTSIYFCQNSRRKRHVHIYHPY